MRDYQLCPSATHPHPLVFAPLLMTVLLLRVSGVALLEKDIVRRRPAYRDYIGRTNAFIPGSPRAERTGP